MAESVTIARPYAEAVFRLARDGKALAAWSGKLKLLATIAGDAEMRGIVANPKFSAEQLAQLVLTVAGADSDKELANFVRVLAGNDRLAVLPEIADSFEALKAEEEGVKEAVVHSAFAMDDAQVKALVAQLETHFKSKLSPQVVVDPELIGGVKVAVGDEVLDASVRGKLDAMAAALKN